jgi:alkylation response protein AidB-like acyl-CoA dehydrogenase
MTGFAAARARARRAGAVATLATLGRDPDPVALLGARLGASERLRDLTVDRLRTRSSGDSTLLLQPVIRTQLVEALTAHLEVAAGATTFDDAATTGVAGAARLDALHRTVTSTDRLLLRCHGATGYLVGGVGGDVDAGERAADRLGRATTAAPAPAQHTAPPAAAQPSGRTAADPAPPGDLPQLRRTARAWARELADRAAVLDADPARAASLVDLAGPRWLATAGIPRDEGGTALRSDGRDVTGASAVERAVVLEELARGDLGATLAAPGPSMSGVLVAHLADDDQRRRFHGALLERPTWTCFALTEPGHGSDATGLRTRADAAPGGSLVLRGEKRYIGNAARADLAVVFARRAPGPLGIGAYLVDARDARFLATPLDTLGLRAAQLCAVRLADLPVDPDDELGRRRRPGRRGLHAAVAVFHRLRPGVAAMAVGVAACAVDVLDDAWPRPPRDVADARAGLVHEIAAVRTLVLDAAYRVDATGDGTAGALAKARACRLAEEVTLEVAHLLGPGARDRFPVLDRAVRAARGLEFMEGARNVQALTAFRGLDAGHLGAP